MSIIVKLTRRDIPVYLLLSTIWLLSRLFQSGNSCSFSHGKLLCLFQWWFFPLFFLPSLFLGLPFGHWTSWTSLHLYYIFSYFPSFAVCTFWQICSILIFISLWMQYLPITWRLSGVVFWICFLNSLCCLHVICFSLCSGFYLLC